MNSTLDKIFKKLTYDYIIEIDQRDRVTARHRDNCHYMEYIIDGRVLDGRLFEEVLLYFYKESSDLTQ